MMNYEKSLNYGFLQINTDLEQPPGPIQEAGVTCTMKHSLSHCPNVLMTAKCEGLPPRVAVTKK